MASNAFTAKTDALHLSEQEIEERYQKILSKWEQPLKDHFRKRMEEGGDDIPFGGKISPMHSQGEKYVKVQKKYMTQELQDELIKNLLKHGGDLSKIPGGFTHCQVMNVRDHYNEKDPDYSMDSNRAPQPDPEKTPKWMLKSKFERYSSMFVAAMFKIEAALMKLAQRKKDDQPVVTYYELCVIHRNCANYLYNYEKENFLCSTPRDLYGLRVYRDMIQDLVDGCCVCQKIDLAPMDQVLSVHERLSLFPEGFETQWIDTRYFSWQCEVDQPWHVDGDAVRRKLHDPELSKRDLNAILDAILKSDPDEEREDKAKEKSDCDASKLPAQFKAKMSMGQTMGKPGAKPKGKKSKKQKNRF